jgi:hypothetical protein
MAALAMWRQCGEETAVLGRDDAWEVVALGRIRRRLVYMASPFNPS